MIIDLAPVLYLLLGIYLLATTTCLVATYFILQPLVRRRGPRPATQKGIRLRGSVKRDARENYGLGRA
jgi:hypothetical protein